MDQFDYNLIAILSAISASVFYFAEEKSKRSIWTFVIWYGVSFLIVLAIFWGAKFIFG